MWYYFLLYLHSVFCIPVSLWMRKSKVHKVKGPRPDGKKDTEKFSGVQGTERRYKRKKVWFS